MYWHKMQPVAQSIFLNFQNLLDECMQHTTPDKNYFFEKNGDDVYFCSQKATALA